MQLSKLCQKQISYICENCDLETPMVCGYLDNSNSVFVFGLL